MAETTSGITVIVPTYKRVADLDRCLAAIDRQLLPPVAVLITYRNEDVETAAYLRQASRPCQGAELLVCESPGVVFALNLAIDQVRSEFFAITDDDSVPHPDWLRRMVDHFNADPQAAGVGGRDNVFTEGRWIEGAEPVVGIIRWNGWPIGNHHVGAGPPRYVHTLKGVNMAFRTAAFGTLRLDTRLRGKGAQVAWELHLTLTLFARGYKLIYDPAVQVDHFPGARPVEEDRVFFNPVSHTDELFNRTLVTIEFLVSQPWGWLRCAVYLGSMMLRGTRKSPGLLLLVYGLLTGYPHTWARFKATFAAYRDALGAARLSARTRPT